MNATLYIWQVERTPGFMAWQWAVFTREQANALTATQFFGYGLTAAFCEMDARQRCPFTLRVLFTSPGETMSREVA